MRSPALCALVIALLGPPGLLACARPGPGAAVAPAGVSPSGAVEPEAGVRVAIGDAHACALGPAGEVMCWGSGQYRRLGRELPAEVQAPVRVALPGPAISLSVALATSCAVVGGRVICWGVRQWLAEPETPSSAPLFELPGVTDATGVVVRAGKVCAARPGGVACWDEEHKEAPQILPNLGNQAIPLRSLAFVAAGVCGLTDEGKPRCWGEVGPVPPLAGATRVSLAERGGCAIEGGGALRCWGSNAPGSDPLSAPAPVEGVEDAVDVVAGADFSCVARRAGPVLCWGLDQEGETGKAGRRGLNPAPLVVEGAEGLVRLAAGVGRGAVCGVGRAGEVRCWGAVVAGREDSLRRAHLAPEIKGAISLATAAEGTCALVPGDQVRCWGNRFVPIERWWRGRGDPVPSVSFAAPRAEALLFLHKKLCMRAVDGAVSCWSFGPEGPPLSEPFALRNVLSEENGILVIKLDDRGNEATRRRLQADQKVRQTGYELSAVDSQESRLQDRSCGIRVDGETRCWMSSQSSAQGRRVAVPQNPSRVELAEGVGCALGEDRQVRCFWTESQDDFQGSIEGRGPDARVRVPLPPIGAWSVEGWSEVTDLRRTGESICALRAGTVECFDARAVIEAHHHSMESVRPALAGSKERFPRWTVEGISGATSLAITDTGGCALLGEGRVACWGHSVGGRLGVEDEALSSLVPTAVPWPR